MLKHPSSSDNPQSDQPPDFPPIDHCIHANQEVRRLTASNNVKHFVFQCLQCGQNLGAIGPSHPARQALTGAPPDFDDTLIRQWQQEKFDRFAIRRQQYEADREQARREWRDRYNAYINSQEWRSRANQRIRMDEGKCQARLKGCTHVAVQVHHLSYDHLGNEPLWELVSVCVECHDQLTAMDRARRGVAA